MDNYCDWDQNRSNQGQNPGQEIDPNRGLDPEQGQGPEDMNQGKELYHFVGTSSINVQTNSNQSRMPRKWCIKDISGQYIHSLQFYIIC